LHKEVISLMKDECMLRSIKEILLSQISLAGILTLLQADARNGMSFWQRNRFYLKVR